MFIKLFLGLSTVFMIGCASAPASLKNRLKTQGVIHQRVTQESVIETTW